jgi:HD-GYP domain-containing protein (c-di-GMP phosphodiesterase class II)
MLSNVEEKRVNEGGEIMKILPEEIEGFKEIGEAGREQYEHVYQVADLMLMFVNFLREKKQDDSLPEEIKAEVAKLPENQWIYLGGLTHDLGKLDDEVLQVIERSYGVKIDDKQRDVFKEHPRRGAERLGGLEYFKNLGNRERDFILEAVRAHHVWFDGGKRGYPEIGLKGKNIPFAGRITAMIDTFAAVAQNRKHADWEEKVEGALEAVNGDSGNKLDPDLVTVFVSFFERDKEKMRELFEKKEVVSGVE